MNSLATLFLIAASSLSSVEAFGTVGNSRTVNIGSSSLTFTQPNAHVPQSRLSRSPLFIASAESPTNGESPIVKSLDNEMKKMQKQRAKFEAKLNEYSSKISQLEEKKQQYLEGASLGQAEATFNETTMRSAVKAMMWRVIAGSVTFITSLKFSGSIAVALKVVGSDFFSKAATMFIGERLMNKSKAGRSSGADSAGRSIAKALIWRLFAICNTLTVCFFISKDFSMASKVAGSDALFKTALMVAFERVWAKIEWGKEYQVDFLI